MAKQSKETIDLLPVEELLRKLLLDCRNHHGSADLDIWFTGGWVRDKLLGGESHDIDVALSSMTGFQFLEALDLHFDHFQEDYTTEAQRIGVPPTIKGLHKIKKKPDKSNQLDTATVEIFGMPVDFVNLRKEVYTEQSRDPQVEFGTAVEDAYRRDATINSIFYNLDRRQVEDHTQMGLSDLAVGIIQTPLQPTQAFTDDPLWILRLIRIASRLGFQMDQNTAQAMKAPVVRTAFNVKITRERVGLEVKKMINGSDPLAAFELLYENDLYSTVFLDQLGYLRQALLHTFPCSGPGIPWPTSWPLAFRNLAFLLQNRSRYSKRDFWGSEARLHIWLMAAWAPLAPLRETYFEQVMKSATGAIKTTRQTSKILGDCLKNMDSVHATVQQVATAPAGIPQSTLGMTIRSWGVSWKLQVLYAMLVDAISQSVDCDAFPDLLHGYLKFMDHVFDQDLENAPLAKPILNGSELKSIFNLTQNGAFLQVAIDGLVQWQFDHEHVSKTDAAEWVLTQKENFHIP